MDGLTLLRQARDAGLAVTAAGGRLVIRGPRRAEPVALMLLAHKPEVLTALDEATDWRARNQEAVAHWGALHPPAEAARLAWGELEDRWHRLHGARVPSWQCAGCGEAIAELPALDLADGNRVHLGDLECVIAYGDRWRGAATAGLRALGLDPLAGAEDEP
jgi:hypothetical protein